MVDSINTNISPVVIPETEQQKPVSTPQFKGNDDNILERIPEEDSFDKKDNTGKKVGIGVLAAAALAVAGDFVFAKGKHVKKIFGMAEKEASKAADETKNKTEEAAKDAKAEAEKIYESIDKQLHKKTEYSPEILDRNLAPKEKAGAWSKEDMAQYYNTDLEIESRKKLKESIDRQLHKKIEYSPEILDRNLAPKEKAGVWSKEDMAQYYNTDLEIEVQKSLKGTFEQAIGVKPKSGIGGSELRAATERQIERTREIINPEVLQEKMPALMKEAEAFAEIIDTKYIPKVKKYIAITNKGFKALSGTPKKMENGSYKIVKQRDNGVRLEFISDDGDKIHRIKTYKGDKLVEQVSYYDKGSTGALAVYDEAGKIKEHVDFDVAKSDVISYMNFETKQQVSSRNYGFYRNADGLKIENLSENPRVIRER